MKTISFKLVERSFALVNVILSANKNVDESELQKQITKRLAALAIILLKFILFLCIILAFCIIPLFLYYISKETKVRDWDNSSLLFYSVAIVSTTLPFVVSLWISPKRDYSDLSKLFHRIMLNNYSLSKTLFSFEKKLFSRKLKTVDNKFVIVTGLARAGTTALTTLLNDTGSFHSLSYANMPLVLSPNLWQKFYKPKDGTLKERSHGDKVLFGYNSIEALEEYFWKVHSDDAFISDDLLLTHSIDENTYSNYLNYQNLLRAKDPDTIYLAKNNNLLLRIESLRKHNKEFITILLFRNPVAHASSLLNQHLRYLKLHHEDEFSLEYMNWLGHHEFGSNHKVFSFESTNIKNPYKSDTLEYWLVVWINYYSHVITMDLSRIIILDYLDFLTMPEETLELLKNKIGVNMEIERVKKFTNKRSKTLEVAQEEKAIAMTIYNKLQLLKSPINLKMS